LARLCGRNRRRERGTRANRLTEEVRVALLALLPGDRAGQAMRLRLLRRWLSTLFD
jgi:hypothetical protein